MTDSPTNGIADDTIYLVKDAPEPVNTGDAGSPLSSYTFLRIAAKASPDAETVEVCGDPGASRSLIGRRFIRTLNHEIERRRGKVKGIGNDRLRVSEWATFDMYLPGMEDGKPTLCKFTRSAWVTDSLGTKPTAQLTARGVTRPSSPSRPAAVPTKEPTAMPTAVPAVVPAEDLPAVPAAELTAVPAFVAEPTALNEPAVKSPGHVISTELVDIQQKAAPRKSSSGPPARRSSSSTACSITCATAHSTTCATALPTAQSNACATAHPTAQSTCRTCGHVFASRNQLFDHFRTHGRVRRSRSSGRASPSVTLNGNDLVRALKNWIIKNSGWRGGKSMQLNQLDPSLWMARMASMVRPG
ncbi:hypothetical protein N657DRAFT_118591 [Parathielavia appendiculata]|uniref:C2H2-type domain-containing protein n=1 Tax=Parathielavia appendiculata TaxID=2587402 RepID=A0AAN6TUT3_9PEZI|nr:hypothetical protein N657DRAFT_118591 [Parathielavia appendiculata]